KAWGRRQMTAVLTGVGTNVGLRALFSLASFATTAANPIGTTLGYTLTGIIAGGASAAAAYYVRTPAEERTVGGLRAAAIRGAIMGGVTGLLTGIVTSTIGTVVKSVGALVGAVGGGLAYAKFGGKNKTLKGWAMAIGGGAIAGLLIEGQLGHLAGPHVGGA